MDLLEQYREMFEEEPPLMMTMTFDHSVYQKLMKKALNRGSPITEDELDEAFKDVQFDVAQPEEFDDMSDLDEFDFETEELDDEREEY